MEMGWLREEYVAGFTGVCTLPNASHPWGRKSWGCQGGDRVKCKERTKGVGLRMGKRKILGFGTFQKELNSEMWNLENKVEIFMKFSHSFLRAVLLFLILFVKFLVSPVFLSFLIRSCGTACGLLVPRPGIEPVSPAVRVQSPNH